MKLFLAVAVLAALAGPAAAQQQARPDPTNPKAPVPALKYDPAFSGYRPFREEPLARWRDTNDEVARAGGHAGIFRESDQPQDAAKPAPKPEPAPAQPGGARKR